VLESVRTRRSVVVGGIAAVGVAIPALAQFDGLASLEIADGLELVGGSGDFTGFLVSERERWEGLVGQSFRIAGEAGLAGATLAAVEQIAFDPLRPETLERSQAFYLHFATAVSGSPVGDRSYPIFHPDMQGSELFLSRGKDNGSETVLVALFN
jgi:hypothetical protein